MANDKRISQLITKSLRHDLTDDESKEVEGHLRDNEQSRNFAQISRAIQGSLIHAAERSVAGDQSVAPALSDNAKQRLKESISAAADEKLSLSNAGLLGDKRRSQTTIESDRRQHISRFRLLRRLGEGGLGNVWLARDEKLNRNVAIKELRPEALESPKAWQRFHREAEITGQLEHPNVVPLYQFGEDRKSGEPFYAMRFVGKRTLADAIVEHHDRIEAGEDETLGLHRLLSAFLDVCQAIAYAHSRGVVHRDLKPENVALDNFGQVIVLDWGLAKVTEDCELAQKLTDVSSLTDSSLMRTMDGDVVGTPLYMAPEQAAGDLDNVDDKTDVYGLGAVLFAILTGSAPHEKSIAGDPLRKLTDVLKAIALGETPRPRDYAPSVPTALEAICVKAMARKRHLRFDSVNDFAEAVERWMAGQHEMKTKYEALRMEGRELRASLQSSVDDLQRNVRFMSCLPPIQQLVKADADTDVSAWRERLATIFEGLLEANPSYRNVAFCRVGDSEFTELVRVERHGREATRIRVVPRSRLRTVKASRFIESLLAEKPEEIITSLVGDPMCEHSAGCGGGHVGLVSGVPIYDEQTEEPFGVVLIDGDLDSILTRQLSQPSSASEVVVACDTLNILAHSKSGQILEESKLTPLAESAPHFLPAMESLGSQLEFIDHNDNAIYGARLWLKPNEHGLVYLLRQGKSGHRSTTSR